MDGVTFPGACADCHGQTTEYPVKGATLGYETSGHNLNGNSYYANGGGCQSCHTHEGFIEYLETGEVGDYIAYPSQQDCFTCHTSHETGDFGLTTSKPVTLKSGDVVDFGDGNLCSNCHLSRANAEEYVQPYDDASKVSSRFGPHHGPQADVLGGVNAFEFAGKTYTSSFHKSVIEDGCVSCHMALPEERYRFSPDIGGHSFRISTEVHERPTVNLTSCVACHEDIGQVRGMEIFDITGKADYDLDGTVEPFQLEVEGLLAAFVNENGTGYLQRLDPPMFDASGSWKAAPSTASRSLAEMGALFNYTMFLEDRSDGIHNPTYTIQILYDSLKALDPSLDDSLRPE